MTNATIVCTRALSELVDDARALRDRAAKLGLEHSTRTLGQAAGTLDRARTRLVEDGADYLDAAWAFLDAGRSMVAQHRLVIENDEARLTHAGA